MDAAEDAEFSDFMHGRWAQLVRLGYGLTGDLQIAEDLAQTAFTRAYASWPRVRRAADPDAYVRKIVVNANLNKVPSAWVIEDLTRSGPRGCPFRRSGEPGRRPRRVDSGPASAAVWAARGRRAQVLAGHDRGRGRGSDGLLGRQRKESGIPCAGQTAGQRRTYRRGSPVSVKDEQEIREQLRLLGTVEVSPPPYLTAVRRGKSVGCAGEPSRQRGWPPWSSWVFSCPASCHMWASQDRSRRGRRNGSPAGPWLAIGPGRVGNDQRQALAAQGGGSAGHLQRLHVLRPGCAMRAGRGQRVAGPG